MQKYLSCALLIACLCMAAVGCAANETQTLSTEQTETVSVTEVSVETMPDTEAPETTPTETTIAPETTETVVTESTDAAEVETDNGITDPHAPLLDPPEVEDGPCHFFDDAAFIGDSITYTLMLHHQKTGDFGDALFLVRGSTGIHNTLERLIKLYYQGEKMTPWDALAASGVNKVFIMLGTNDIGYYGIDDTMEKWEEFLGNIREACPDIQVYIQSLTPMWSEGEVGILNNENIDLYNERLKAFAEENGCFYVDVTTYLKDATNGLAEVYSNDRYVHMNYEGTAVWADTLKLYAASLEKENP